MDLRSSRKSRAKHDRVPANLLQKCGQSNPSGENIFRKGDLISNIYRMKYPRSLKEIKFLSIITLELRCNNKRRY